MASFQKKEIPRTAEHTTLVGPTMTPSQTLGNEKKTLYDLSGGSSAVYDAVRLFQESKVVVLDLDYLPAGTSLPTKELQLAGHVYLSCIRWFISPSCTQP